jgi:peptidoglycan/xylan/chitin deacetylase (PgdA/CDA1 family)
VKIIRLKQTHNINRILRISYEKEIVKMIHKHRFTRLLITVLVCFVVVSGIYSMRKQASFSNTVQLLKNKPLPQLNNGPEYKNRRPDHSPQLGNIVYYEGTNTKKEVALTFDDGPDTVFTPQILDILKKNNIKATFFIVGNRAEANKEIIKRIAKEGHAIGNHSWDHADLDRLGPDQIIYEIKKTEDTLFSLLGYRPSIVRPPYGAADKKVLQKIGDMGYRVIDWSVDSLDWLGTPPKMITYIVKKETRPGGIILQHCASGKRENLSNTITALPEIIQYLKSANYTFVKVPELLNVSSSL